FPAVSPVWEPVRERGIGTSKTRSLSPFSHRLPEAAEIRSRYCYWVRVLPRIQVIRQTSSLANANTRSARARGEASFNWCGRHIAFPESLLATWLTPVASMLDGLWATSLAWIRTGL